MDRRLRQIALLGLLAGLTAAPVWAQSGRTVDPAASGETALLRALDKVTTRRTDLEIPVGETVTFGTLEIQIDYCRSRPPQEAPESFVLMTVTDKATAGEPEVVFDGWMLASVPGLNPLEHPVYDLWAIGCRMKGERGADDGKD
jgi:hypothetical protein